MNQQSEQNLLEIRMLGSSEICLNGVPILGLSAAKSRALIFYLAVTGSAHSREALAGLFWPQMPEADAKTNLRQTLAKTRKALPLHIEITRHQIALNPEAQLHVDTITFAESVLHSNTSNREEIENLQTAADLYRGDFLSDFLEGLNLTDEDWFLEWALIERQRLRTFALQTLHTLTAHFTQRREIELGLRYTRQLLTLEPTREESHQQMMKLLAWGGQYGDALAQYETCRRLLADELGLAPLPTTTALFERVRSAQGLQRNNFPTDATAFVGRHAHLDELHRWLHEPDNRLMTITGPGGVGKTRFALQVALQQNMLFLNGVYFVDLSRVDTMAQIVVQIVAAIASAIGMTIHGTKEAVDQLCNYLNDKELLLILDNFEHLLQDDHADDAVALLEECLAAAADLKLLVTSRERLNLQEELLFELDGLPTPKLHDLSGVAHDVAAYAALQLFDQTARLMQPRFDFAQEQAAVVQICHLVQGLPLAIKLAASLKGVPSCAERAKMIAANLDALAQENPDTPERQQSMRATLDYSWTLLTPAEQTLLAQLSVFRGGFEFDAVSKIAGTELAGAGIAGARTPIMLLETLTALIEKSLLRLGQSGRYEMHNLVVQFAAERLADEPSKANEVRQQHCAYYIALIEEQGDALNGLDMSDAVAKIQRDLSNIRRAWQRAVDQFDVRALRQGCDGLERFYFMTNQFSEGQAMMKVAVDAFSAEVANSLSREHEAAKQIAQGLAAALTSLARLLMIQRRYAQAIETAQTALGWSQQSEAADLIIRNQYCWGVTLHQQGHYGEAQKLIDGGVELAALEQLPLLEATGWHHQGSIQYNLANYAEAREYYTKAWEYFDHLAPSFSIQRASLLNNLGNVHLQLGGLCQAESFYLDSLALRRIAGNQQLGGAVTIFNLGLVALFQHKYTDAQAHYTEALHAYRRNGNRHGESMVLGGLGELYHKLGDYARARELYEQDIAIMHETGHQGRMGSTLARLGMLWHSLGDFAQASRLCQQAVELAQSQGGQNILGSALTFLGHVQMGRDEDEAAATTYQEALLLLRQLGQRTLALEALAGLARLDVKRGEHRQAQTRVDEILYHLTTNNLDSTFAPIQITLTCYEVLAQNHDNRAQDILTTAYHQLQDYASRIEGEDLRTLFLNNVAAHQALIVAYQAMSLPSSPAMPPEVDDA